MARQRDVTANLGSRPPAASGMTGPAVSACRGGAIHLRPLTLADVGERYVAWLNDPAVNRFLETRHQVQTLETVRSFVAVNSGRADRRLFAICLNETERHIGNIKVGPIKPNHALADVSLFIGERDCWGKGYATEAITLASRFAFAQMPVVKLSASFYATNVASIRAFLKAGYREEGLRRRHYLLDGKLSDIVELGLCAEDYGYAGRDAAAHD
jgi:RimJ/RimL family protein N-acetyltransferase